MGALSSWAGPGGGPAAFIRNFRPGDREALADICVRTADNGGDSRHLCPDPALFAAPCAVHLSVLTANTPARAFYDRLGFTGIDVPDPGPVTYLGRSTDTMGRGRGAGVWRQRAGQVLVCEPGRGPWRLLRRSV